MGDRARDPTRGSGFGKAGRRGAVSRVALRYAEGWSRAMRRVGGERSMVKRIVIAVVALTACHRDSALPPDALAVADATGDALTSDAGVATIVVPTTTGPIKID